MNILIVDGYNVIHAFPPLRRLLDRSLAEARAALAQSLGRLALAKKGNVDIHVFFDSKEDMGFFDAEPSVAGVSVHFPYSGETADEAILELLRKIENRASATVVTDDYRLARRAGDDGAQAISTADLARRLSKV